MMFATLSLLALCCCVEGLLRVPLTREKVRAAPVVRTGPRRTRWDGVFGPNWRKEVTRAIPKVWFSLFFFFFFF
jgi:hypothetical protein